MTNDEFEYLKEKCFSCLSYGSNLHKGFSKTEIEDKIKTGDAEIYVKDFSVNIKVYYLNDNNERVYIIACC